MAAGSSARDREAGVVTLESMLVLPIVALLLFAVLGSLSLVSGQLTVTQAARAGARAVAITGRTGSAHAVVTAALPSASVSATIRDRVARVEVVRRTTLLGVDHLVRAEAAAPLEPVAG